jgi:DNA invertase Pin-like site-specific DNA recombinase
MNTSEPLPGSDFSQSPVERSGPLPPGMRSAKIHNQHLDKWAVIYVRQSSLQQVHEHRESRERQYALAEVANVWGWPRERIRIIDEDQGVSGQFASNRTGFQLLLSELSLGHVGLVMGLEMSRLARSSRDWHHLIELCALVEALLADQEGVYNPQDANDRLLLGLKGTMSEFELVTMRNRLERGRLHKAQRGELFHSFPTGFVRQLSGGITLDPNEQVQGVIRLIFAKFDELGTVGRLLHYLWEHDIQLGFRQGGSKQGQLEWHRAHASTLQEILHRPIYAGAYAYGRSQHYRQVTAERPEGVYRQRRLPMSQWKVLLPNRWPGYIDWEHFEANQLRLQRNRPRAGEPGAPRQGKALLAGLVTCKRCGHAMQVEYPHRGRPVYRCRWKSKNGYGTACGSLRAEALDEIVAAQTLQALEPASLELSLRALHDIQQERSRLETHWQRRLEQARYEVQRAERQYQRVEPENRMVARTLEGNWENALRQERALQEEYDRFLRQRPQSLGQQEQQRIAALSEDIPTLWRAETTAMADRKTIVRCLVDKVEVWWQSDSEQTEATIHWQGGATTHQVFSRPVKEYVQFRQGQALLERLRQLREAGYSAPAMVAQLNAEGFTAPQRRGPLTYDIVRQLLIRLGLTHGRKKQFPLAKYEWWLKDLAAKIQVGEKTLIKWLQYGWVNGRQVPFQRFWIIWADGAEQNRLKRLKTAIHQKQQPLPTKLTTPSQKSSR